MANRTVKDAHTIHGTNPQYLVEKIIRGRIYECKYWKEECFALSAELLVDKGMELRYVGGVYGGNIKPTPFICLLLKMLQIQPEKDIVVEFIRQEDSKYIRALGAIYLRLTGSSLDIYKYLEPLYNDYRKLRFQLRDGTFVLSYVDQFIDDLLHEERVCDIILPRLQKRYVLEEAGQLENRVSALDDMEDDEEIEDALEEINQEEENRKLKLKEKEAEKKKERERETRGKERDRSRERDAERSRRRSRERDRREDSRERDSGRRDRREKERERRDDRRDRGDDRRDRGDDRRERRERRRGDSRERRDDRMYDRRYRSRSRSRDRDYGRRR